MNNERVLVTGATGFIGGALFRQLKAFHYDVDGIAIDGDSSADERISRVDLTSTEELCRFAEGKAYRAIFHLAAAIPPSFEGEGADACFLPNITSAKNILALALSQKNCHLIYASSVSVYGGNREIPLSEEALPLPDNYYALSKYTGELLCCLHRGQMPVTIFRISSPYGPGYKRQTVMQIFCSKVLKSEPVTLFGSGERRQDFIYIEDIVDAFIHVFRNSISGVFNLCSGVTVSMRELAELVLALVPDSRSRIIYSGQADPNENVSVGYSIDKLKKCSGFVPRTSLESGLQKYFASFNI